MLLGNVGMPVGTELVVPIAGALAATGHLSSVWLAASVATLGEVAGASILYAVGFYGGRPFVEKYGRYVMFRAHELDRVQAFYERYGNNTVFISRFIPFVRGVASLPAGMSRMPRGRFLAATTAGSLIFCFGLAYLGQSFGRNIDRITPLLHRFSLTIALVVGLAIALAVALQLLRRKR